MPPIRLAPLCLSVAAVLTSHALLAQTPASGTEKSAAAASSPSPTPDAPIFDPDALAEKQVDWYKVVCQQSNRRMLVVLGTNDCQPCRVVNRALYAKGFYEVLLKQFVPVFIDVTPGSSNETWMKARGFDPGQPLPAVLIFDNKLNLVEALIKGEMVAVTAKGDEAVQHWVLQRFVKTEY